MIRLIKIEFQKIIYNPTAWVIFGLHILLFVPTLLGLEGILKNLTTQSQIGNNTTSISLKDFSVFSYPTIWHNITYLASWFKLILAVLVVIVVTNEYNYKTIRQNIIDGMSKWEIIWGKELVILLLSTTSTLFMMLLILFVGKDNANNDIFEGSEYIISYFISLLVYLNFAYFLSTWLKKAGLAIALLFLYTILIENIISWSIPNSIEPYLLMNTIDSLIPSPVGQITGKDVSANLSISNIGMCLTYITVFIGLNYNMLRKGKM